MESSRFGFHSHLGLERHNDNKILLRSKVEITWPHVCSRVCDSPISTSKVLLHVEPGCKGIILNALILKCQICFVGDLDLGQPKLPQTVVAAFGMLQLLFSYAFYSFLFSTGCCGIKETWYLLPNASPQLISSLLSSCSGWSVGNPDAMSTGEAAGSLATWISGRNQH